MNHPSDRLKDSEKSDEGNPAEQLVSKKIEPKIVYKPVISAEQAQAQLSRFDAHDPCLRAENEDDDGYDPYSDRVERSELFEDDPWR